ncbi:hypothetical protein P7H42_02730 [Vagococcus lutrae]|nr:hypothetical protein [Vagococcus lutrae]MDT2818681.1 hypothetical protein [Vagococcus lutrae]MDT2843752.1 hypothetical protein [Vagococcus lutrae]
MCNKCYGRHAQFQSNVTTGITTFKECNCVSIDERIKLSDERIKRTRERMRALRERDVNVVHV